MNPKHSLYAFLAVISGIVSLAFIAAWQMQFDSQVFASAITGLIGVAGSFRPKTSNDQPNDKE
jgi:hypothetical protein